MLARVELKGDSDGAVQLQTQFKLSSLGTPRIADPPNIPMFDNKELMGVDIFDDLDAKFASALDVLPNAAEMQQKTRAVAAYAASNNQARDAVNKLLTEKVVREFQEYATTRAAPYRNHWMGGALTGNYGADYSLRTMLNFMGIWANSADEVIYFGAFRDADEKP
jgi:hypothetical protein